MADNDHKSIPDSQLHVPKGFATASNGDAIRKDLNGDVSWNANPWRLQVIDLADCNATPPTEVDGDRYIIIEVASTVVDAGWDGLLINDIAEYDNASDTWNGLTPVAGATIYDQDSGNTYQFNGTSWSNFGNAIWTENGTDLYHTGGNVGINDGSPSYDLSVKNDLGTGCIEWKNSSDAQLGILTNYGALFLYGTATGTAHSISATENKNNAAVIKISNSNAGTAAVTRFIASTDNGSMQLETYSSAYTTSTNQSGFAVLRVTSNLSGIILRCDDSNAAIHTMFGATTTDGDIKSTQTAAGLRIGDKGTPSTTLDVRGNSSVNGGQSWEAIQSTLTPAGTTQTIDWDNGNFAVLDLGSASGNVTLTLSNPNAGAFYFIKVIQSATARTLTWPAAVLWPGGTAITLSTGNDEVDTISLSYDGTNYLATFGNNYS